MKKITRFKTGAVRDVQTNKEDYIESISWLALKRYCDYMEVASQKYGRGNWIKGIPQSSYERSLMRHLQKYFVHKYYGQKFPKEKDSLSAALFNLLGLMHEQEIERLGLRKK